MSQFTLTYVLTTFNKLDYLKITLPYLIQACKPDEEIVIVDGGSTDGTNEFLSTLFKENKIHTFVSEKDHGEAHGTNKALLMARGDLIKIITDDDLFDFKAIQICKKYMQEHPETDVLGFDGYSCKVSDKPKFERTNFIQGFYNWKNEGSAFLFCGLSLLIRRSSLTYLGLFNTNYKIVDMEYTLRISTLKGHIAFYTGLAFINIVNPGSNSVKFYDSIRKEFTKLRRTYPKAHLNFRLNNPILMMKERLHRMALKIQPAPLPDSAWILKNYKELVQKGQDLFTLNQKQTPTIIDAKS